MKNAGRTSSKTVLVILLLGSMSFAWTLKFVPFAIARGYVKVSSASYFAAIFAPFMLGFCVAAVLSGSWRSWYGSKIGDPQQSFDRSQLYMLVWILGIALTGLAFSVFRLLTSYGSSQTFHIYASAGFLLVILVSLWAPKIGVLRHG